MLLSKFNYSMLPSFYLKNIFIWNVWISTDDAVLLSIINYINNRETWSTIMGPVYNSRYPILTLVCKIPLLARCTRPKAHGLAAAIRPSARANKDILLHLTRCISRKCEIGGKKRRRAGKIWRWLGFKYLAYNNGTHRWSMRARDMLVAWGKMNLPMTDDTVLLLKS